MKKVPEGKTIVWMDGNQVRLGESYHCDRCGGLCAVNGVALLNFSSVPSAALAAGAIPLRNVVPDEDGGATDDGDCICGACYAQEERA